MFKVWQIKSLPKVLQSGRSGRTRSRRRSRQPFLYSEFSGKNNGVLSVSTAWTKKVNVEGKVLDFKIDTGADVNVLPLNVYNNLK